MKKENKKRVIIFILLIFAINIFASSILADDKVAYVYKSKSQIDKNIVNVFKDMGLKVDLINEKNLPSNFDGYRFVFIGDERFKYNSKIKIWEFPVIVSNYFFGDDWGLTDDDEISKLAASSPLSVQKDNKIIQVYNKARSNGVSIPYYYLDKGNKAEDLIGVASPYINNGNNLGDVISYGKPGTKLSNGQSTEDKICFFGIIESDFWTKDAREMFEECIEFVGVTCENDNDCGTEINPHSFCVGNKVFQEVKEFECKNPKTVHSQCLSDMETKFVKECPVACNNGKCVCFDNDIDRFDNCNIGQDGDDNKQLDCNDNDNSIYPGNLEICDGKDNDCDNVIDEANGMCSSGSICTLGVCKAFQCSDNLDNDKDGLIDSKDPGCWDNIGNPKTYNPNLDDESRGTLACSSENDCGKDGFSKDAFCKEGNLHKNYTDFTCNNPGTGLSTCTQKKTSVIIEDCNGNEICDMGQCVQIACSKNLDCGNDQLIDGLYCKQNDVFRNFREFKCENPGTLYSSCTQTIKPVLINDCKDSCLDGSCVKIVCGNNNDCNDNNSNTIDICNNPGTVNSYCNHEDIACFSNNECGSDRFIGGLFCQGKDVHRNFTSYACNLPGSTNSFCSNSITKKLVQSCQYSCSNGNCVRCNDNNNCNDNNSNTIDNCRFAGTIDSYCIYENIACFKDSNCGEDKFIGDKFCKDNNVHQNFKVFSCLNPGTSISICNFQVDAILVEQCLYGCNNGTCNLKPVGLNPSIKILTPLNNEVINSNSFLLIFNTTNWIVGGKNSSHIHFHIDNAPGLSYVDHLMFYNHDNVVELNLVPGITSFATWINQNTLRFNNISNGIHKIRAHLATQAHLPTGNQEGDIEILVNVGVCFDRDKDVYDNCKVGDPSDDGKTLDCNDNDNMVYPGALEICDGKDNDCDNVIDGVSNLCEAGKICVTGMCVSDSNNPKGYLDTGDCTKLFGWTCDSDNYNQALTVHIYDGAGSGQVFLGAVTANTSREPQVGALCGGNSNHGFIFPISNSIKNGKDHSLYAYAINIDSGNSNPLLIGSPKTINCNILQCSDGIDNDEDGKIDSLVEINPNNVLSYTFTDATDIKLFVNSFPQYTDIPMYGNEGLVRADATTALQVCKMKGFGMATITATDYFRSCNDNTVGYWDQSLNNFVIYNACLFNSHINSMICTGAIGNCSDNVDNDLDGFIDYPKDSGCASPKDNSEIQHDLQCENSDDKDEFL